jgi:hypothetical protein
MLQYVESRGNVEGPVRLYHIKRCLNGGVYTGLVWYGMVVGFPEHGEKLLGP